MPQVNSNGDPQMQYKINVKIKVFCHDIYEIGISVQFSNPCREIRISASNRENHEWIKAYIENYTYMMC